MDDKSGKDKRRGGPAGGKGRSFGGGGSRGGGGDRPPGRFTRSGPPGGGRDAGDRPIRRRFDGPRTDAPASGERPPRRADFKRDSDKPQRGSARPWREKEIRERPKREPTPRTVERAEGEERIAKVIARAGVCSRRDAEAMIEAGRVAVNGAVLASPAYNVGPDDKVTIDGAPLAKRERTRMWMFHKPAGYVTTESDPEDRPTIHDVLPPELPRVVTIGRLDINTEGLLLLTNDGGLARVLELPSTGWLRRYRARAHGETDQARLDKLRDGVTIDGVQYGGVEARFERAIGSNVWLSIGIREGKNREVKVILESIGLSVNRLIRVGFGPFQLQDLAEGAVEEVPTRTLRDQLGEKLAAAAGVDFETKVAEARDEAPRARRDERPRDRHDERPRERSPERRPFRGRDARAAPDTLPERPVLERPKSGQRKHVSALRSAAAEPRGERVRVERAETTDRHGRGVKVERLRPVAPAAKKDRSTRNARRFDDERSGAPPRRKSFDGPPRDDRAPRRERSEGGDRPPRRESGDGPPKRDFASRGPKRDFAPRGPERDFGDRPPRRDVEGKPRTERPRGDFERKPREDRPRSEGDRPRGNFSRGPGSDRPRGDFDPKPREDRPQREGERPRRNFRDKPAGGRGPRGDFGDRPPRRDGDDRPRGGKPGGRPSGGKPGGRPGFGRAGGGKPGGGRPGGDKPRGPRPPRRDG